MVKKKGNLILNAIFIVVEFFYVCVTMFGLNTIDLAEFTKQKIMINLLYVFVMALMVLCSFISFKKRNENLFYIWKTLISAIVIIGEFIILTESIYLKVFIGIPILLSMLSYYNNKKREYK